MNLYYNGNCDRYIPEIEILQQIRKENKVANTT